MISGRHHVARALRLIVACLALVVVASPPALGAPRVDPIAWAASSEAMADVAQSWVARPSRPARVARRAPPIVSLHCEPSGPAPAGARTVVVQARLYLRHEALLR
jgi:hypothetical protein